MLNDIPGAIGGVVTAAVGGGGGGGMGSEAAAASGSSQLVQVRSSEVTRGSYQSIEQIMSLSCCVWTSMRLHLSTNLLGYSLSLLLPLNPGLRLGILQSRLLRPPAPYCYWSPSE